jgi:hypothetical protein
MRPEEMLISVHQQLVQNAKYMSYQLHSRELYFEKLTVAQLVNKFHFMEAESSPPRHVQNG